MVSKLQFVNKNIMVLGSASLLSFCCTHASINFVHDVNYSLFRDVCIANQHKTMTSVCPAAVYINTHVNHFVKETLHTHIQLKLRVFRYNWLQQVIISNKSHLYNLCDIGSGTSE